MIDRDSGAKTRNRVNIRLIHYAEEHASIAREAFDITALTFGVNRIKSKARLTGTRQTSQYHELIAWNIDVNVLEVMLAGATNLYKVISVHRIYYILDFIKKQAPARAGNTTILDLGVAEAVMPKH